MSFQNQIFPDKLPGLFENSYSNEATVVTSYFDLGSFAKGSREHVFTKQKYLDWMKVFRNIRNPLVAYADTQETQTYIKQLRSHLPANRTKIILVERQHLWSFGLRDKIGKIYSDRNYPKHLPNTVIPEYELMKNSIENNFFKTKYFCWLDIGYFRDISDSKETFTLFLPNGFNHSHIAYQQVYKPNFSLKPREIFRRNLVWIGGGFFIGEKGFMLKWTDIYRRHVEQYLAQGLMNSDQQVLYAMFATGDHQKKPRIGLQIYIAKKDNPWFSLGYLSKEAGRIAGQNKE
jgi:hypothetical protein